MEEGFFKLLLNDINEGGETIKKYPFVKQRNLKDCGVASLLMMIRYYGGDIHFETLEEWCKISKKGISAYHLLEAGKMIGLQGKGYHTSLEKIKPSMLPCIVHVTTKQNYLHYMVLYEIRKKEVILGDPAIGIQKMKIEKFLEIFNETVLVFKPIRILPKECQKKKMIPWVLSYLKKYYIDIITILFGSLLTFVLIISTSFSVQFFLYGLNQKKEFLITTFLILFLLLSLLKTIFLSYRNQKIIHLDQSINNTITKEVFRKIILLPFTYFHNKTVGEIMDRFSDISLLKNVIIEIFIQDSLSLLLSICTFIVLIFINKTFAFYALLCFFLHIMFFLLFVPKLKQKIQNFKRKREQYIAFTYESFENYETIKGSHQEKEIQKQFEKVFEDYQQESYEYQKLIQKMELTKSFIEQTSHLILLYIGVFMILKNNLTLSQLFTLEFLLPIFLDPTYQFMNHISNIKESQESFQRIMGLFNTIQEKGFIESKIKGKITCNHLTFSYDDKTNILEDVNMNIKEKEKIMIVGPSGSGKSTLFHLLMGYYKVPRGMIYLDDIDINDYKTKTLKDNIILLSQTEKLFSDTIYNNLTFFKKRNPNKIIKINKKTLVHSIIDKNSLGYFYPLEENGFNLSGGERQRIMLSRTLLLNFNILLIDEGLNQIDEESERIILQNIFEEYQDKTILVISHREKNTDLFDRTIYIKEGKI